jgi:hypothetical protein
MLRRVTLSHLMHYGSTLTLQNISYCHSEVALEIHVGLKYVTLNTTKRNDAECELLKMKMLDFA